MSRSECRAPFGARGRRAAATCVVAFGLFASGPAAAQCGGVMEIEHEVEVPGTGDPDAMPPVPNQKIKIIEEFKVTRKGNPGAVSYKLKVTNPNARDVPFIICAMIDAVRKKDKWMPHLAYQIKKVDGTWDCVQTPNAEWTPSYHFGCRQVEIGAGKKCVEIFCKAAAPICLKPNDELKRKDKLYTYVDILKDCPTTNWLKAGGAKNIWLVPDTSQVDDEDVASTWITGDPPSEIFDEDEETSLKWSLGNFFTMAQMNTTVQAHMTGAFTGLPPGTPVTLELPATGTFDFVVPPDGNLAIDLPFLIPAMAITPEDGPFACLKWLPVILVPDGHEAHFFATVVTGPNPPPPYQGPGEFMYTIQKWLVQDTVPPEVLAIDVLEGPNCHVEAIVHAVDQTTQPVFATAAWASNPDDVTVLPVVAGSDQFGAKSFAGNVRRSPISNTLVLTVVDDAENETIVQLMVEGDPQCACPDLDGSGIVGGGDLGILLAGWGPCGPVCPADLNGDGVVNGADLGILLGDWGTSCAIPACPGNESCFVDHGGGGCNDLACCEMVTAVFPNCGVWWDEGCADAARAFCAATACGQPEAGDCFVADYGPYCDDPTCCAAVCAIDTFCCEKGWDLVCAFKAGQLCGADCCVAHADPGCGNPVCEAAVCAVDPICCQNQWDGICAAEAAQFCSDACGSPSTCPPAVNDCCTVGGPGCSDPVCCEQVCAIDPFCCDTAWDGICVGEAGAVCGLTCGDCPDLPCFGTLEGEPCGADTNGGCNNPGLLFGSIACGETICGEGWAMGGTRDTDWFELTLDAATEITVTGSAQFAFVIGIVDTGGVPDCALATAVDPFALGEACATGAFTRCLDAGTWWVFMAPNAFDGVPCDGGATNYALTLACGGACAAVSCGDAGHDCLTTGGPFCDDEACCLAVCAIDPFCCDVAWDSICVDEATANCGPVANDECVNLLPIGLGKTPFSTLGATTSGPPLPPECERGFGLALVNDIWYGYAPGFDGILNVSLCGSDYDTRIAVYGGSCGHLLLEACNDDFCGLQSQLDVPVSGGVTYILRVGGFNGSGTGTITLSQ